MTGPEKEDLRELRVEMREAFREVNEGLRDISTRVGSLEMTRAEDNAVRAERRTSLDRITSERRWRVGLITGLAISGLIGLVNLLANVGMFGPLPG